MPIVIRILHAVERGVVKIKKEKMDRDERTI
jgi:hypothetical protein